MRILVNSGDHKCSNMGDLAMLKIAVRRLDRLFPGATIRVLTSNPEVLEDEVTTAKALSSTVLQRWFSDRCLFGSLHNALPKGASRALRFGNRKLRRNAPRIMEALVKAKIKLLKLDDTDILDFLANMRQVDLVVLCGQGTLADVFIKDSYALLDFVEMAVRNGRRTVMFGQGIGPLTDPGLQERAKAVLPTAEMIALREGKKGPALLSRMGVDPDVVVTTGDDAIELAYEARPERLGNAIGVNIRIATHSAIGSELASRLRHVFAKFADLHDTELLSIPISRYPNLKDACDIEQMLSGIERFGDDGKGLDTPVKVIRQVGRCRVLMTAAYHAAVFALSQGVPVVGMASSQYCRDKFLGLKHHFGPGIEIVDLNGPAAETDVFEAAARLWKTADEIRPNLLRNAQQQIEAGRAAYARVANAALFKKPLPKRDAKLLFG